jgi:hypothetical protein
VPVPLDWRHPGGQRITLSVIRHLASHPEQRIGSLFLAPSGPGDSGVAEITTRGQALDAMTEGRFDMGWDIRGSWAAPRCAASLRQRAGQLLAVLAGAHHPPRRAAVPGQDGRAGATLRRQSTALICADSPARQPASAWPRVVDRLEADSRIGGPVVGWLAGAPCASWPTPSTDRYTGPWTPLPSIQSWSSVPGSTPPRRFVTPGWRRGGWATRSCSFTTAMVTSPRRDPSSCVKQAIGHYLVDLATPPSGTVCPSDRLPFDPDFGQPVP